MTVFRVQNIQDPECPPIVFKRGNMSLAGALAPWIHHPSDEEIHALVVLDGALLEDPSQLGDGECQSLQKMLGIQISIER